MSFDQSIGDVYDDLQNRLSRARTHALMQEEEQAESMLAAASLEFTRYQDSLRTFPGYWALEHAFTTTRASLRNEHASQPPLPAKKKGRRK